MVTSFFVVDGVLTAGTAAFMYAGNRQRHEPDQRVRGGSRAGQWLRRARTPSPRRPASTARTSPTIPTASATPSSRPLPVSAHIQFVTRARPCG